MVETTHRLGRKHETDSSEPRESRSFRGIALKKKAPIRRICPH